VSRYTLVWDAERDAFVERGTVRARKAAKRPAWPFEVTVVEKGSWILDSATGELVPRGEYRRPVGAGHSVISDTMEVRGMFDGKTYTSKRGYAREVKRRGLQIVGNDSMDSVERNKWKPDRREIERSVADTYNQLEAGYGRR